MAEPTRILIAEDGSLVPSTLRGMLRDWGYEVVAADDGPAAFSLLREEEGPRLAILDSKLPGLGALEICRRVRALNQLNYAYLLMLGENGPVEDLMAALDAGADGYIGRPFPPIELRLRVEAGRRIVQMQERQILARRELQEQASRDSLTGLWNKKAIVGILESETSRARRAGASLSVIMADLDHFKSINDRFGHMAGDKVLREATHRMSSMLRNYDSIGRFGGEEFLIVLPGCRRAAALAVAERLREVVACQPYIFNGAVCNATCSFGLACGDCRGTTDAGWLMQQADIALYSAKRHGRNRVEASILAEV